MKLFSIATLLAAVVSTVNAIIVNTPTNVVACQPLLITWDPQGSAGPFFLSVVPGTSPTSPAIVSWSNLTGTSLSWTVNQTAGTSLGLLLRDQVGNVSQSAPFIVQPGTTTCSNSTNTTTTLPLSTSSLPLTNSTSSTATLPKTTTTTPLTPTTKPPTPLSTTTTSPRPATTSPGNSSGNLGGALSNTVNFVSVGLLAALAGAILA